jgi:hypothetical protein
MPYNVYVSHMYILKKENRSFNYFLLFKNNKNMDHAPQREFSFDTIKTNSQDKAQMIDFEHNGDWEATSILTLTLITLCTKNTPGKLGY